MKKSYDDYYEEKIYAITDESICVFSTNKLVHHLANGHFHELKFFYPNDSFFLFHNSQFIFFSFFFLLFTFSFFFFGYIDIKKLIFLLYSNRLFVLVIIKNSLLLRILSHKFIKFHIHWFNIYLLSEIRKKTLH